MLISKFRDVHQRLVVRRQRIWGQRISDNAADKSVRFLEFMFVGYAQAIPFLVVFVALKQFRLDLLANVGLVVSLVIGLLCFVTALHYGKEAGLDIARSYGLPDSAWRRVKAKTSDQFDGWLAKEKNRGSNSRVDPGLPPDLNP